MYIHVVDYMHVHIIPLIVYFIWFIVNTSTENVKQTLFFYL